MTTQFRRLFSPREDRTPRGEELHRLHPTRRGVRRRRAASPTATSATTRRRRKGGCGTVMMFGSSSIHPTSVNDWGEVNNWDDSIIPSSGR